MFITENIGSYIAWRLFPPKAPYMLVLYCDAFEDTPLTHSLSQNTKMPTFADHLFDLFHRYRLQTKHLVHLPLQLDRCFQEPEGAQQRIVIVCRTEKSAYEIGNKFLRITNKGSSYDVAPSKPSIFIWWKNDRQTYKTTESENIHDDLALSLIHKTEKEALDILFPDTYQEQHKYHHDKSMTTLVTGENVKNKTLIKSLNNLLKLKKINIEIENFADAPIRSMKPRVFINDIVEQDLQKIAKLAIMVQRKPKI